MRVRLVSVANKLATVPRLPALQVVKQPVKDFNSYCFLNRSILLQLTLLGAWVMHM